MYHRNRNSLHVCSCMEIVRRICVDDIQAYQCGFEDEEAILDLSGMLAIESTNEGQLIQSF